MADPIMREFDESKFVDGVPLSPEETPGIMAAIGQLQRAPLTPFALRRRQPQPRAGEEVLRCELRYEANGTLSPRVFTSHYVGSFSAPVTWAGENRLVVLQVRPRFGSHPQVFSHLLTHAYGIYLPPLAAQSVPEKAKADADLLLTLLWKVTLERALSRGQIPKEYRKTKGNLRAFRGRLALADHLRLNLTDQSRVACSYRRLTTDVTINRTIRYTYALLQRSHLGPITHGLAEYDLRLASLGVSSGPVSLADINRQRYTRLNASYRPVMDLSRAIICRFSAKTDALRGRDSRSFFLDMAELWEGYLLMVLRRYLSGYEVWSPNDEEGDWLISPALRRIRPDLIIANPDGTPVAVLEAKYKAYRQLGATEKGGVSREDLHQLTTYMYHYATSGQPFLGLIVSPCDGLDTADVNSMAAQSNHRIGVLNLDITKWDCGGNYNVQTMEEAEAGFAATVQRLLDQRS